MYTSKALDTCLTLTKLQIQPYQEVKRSDDSYIKRLESEVNPALLCALSEGRQELATACSLDAKMAKAVASMCIRMAKIILVKHVNIFAMSQQSKVPKSKIEYKLNVNNEVDVLTYTRCCCYCCNLSRR